MIDDSCLPGLVLADTLISAANDFRYLLSRGYPRDGSLIFVGNHYQLLKQDRQLLARGVFPAEEALARRARLLPVEEIKGRSMAVDGHNVLITLESALSGRILVQGDDGPIRDIAGLSGRYRPSATTGLAVTMVLNFLRSYEVGSILFLFDAPMSLSGALAAEVGAAMAECSLMGRARTAPVPEMELLTFPGLVATADSVLIDRVSAPMDLAGHIIREQLPHISCVRFS